MRRMRTRRYGMALACYLAIPAVVIAGVRLSRLIDPELARASADYARNFRLLELAATGALMATAGLALALWVATCYLVLRSRQRSVLWLALAAAGPFGFMFIAMLAQRTLRHKTQKQSFQVTFWATVVLNCAALGWLLSPSGMRAAKSLLGGA